MKKVLLAAMLITVSASSLLAGDTILWRQNISIFLENRDQFDLRDPIHVAKFDSFGNCMYAADSIMKQPGEHVRWWCTN